MTATRYAKRLIEVDLPIKEISAHARREKSIRHGHISTLHIWWARRPLAACRAVLCAALWPDPGDEECPISFRSAAAKILSDFAEKVRSDKQVMELCASHWNRWRTMDEKRLCQNDAAALLEMRGALLDFIASFASWDASNVDAFRTASEALTVAAHLSLGGASGTRPLVVDPFAGGGAIPLEALRVGSDTYASDLNPVAVTLNRVALVYLPRFGTRLAEEVDRWGQWVWRQSEADLARFYPPGPDGSTPIAYLWARTVRCEGPGCGVEIPLIRSLVLAKKARRTVLLGLHHNQKAQHVEFELQESERGGAAAAAGTVRKGSALCPACGYTTPNARVRAQLAGRRGGASDARLVAVVSVKTGEQGRRYRLPTPQDLEAAQAAARELKRRVAAHDGKLSLVPDEPVSKARPSPNARGLSAVTRMGVETFGDLFAPRQLLALTTLARFCRKAASDDGGEARPLPPDLAAAVRVCLALSLSKAADLGNSCTRWKADAECPVNLFARQAIPIVWDFAETATLSESSGSWRSMYERTASSLAAAVYGASGTATVEMGSATAHHLPDDSVNAFITDPPYYDAVPYSDLSDFFYVWLRRVLADEHSELFSESTTPKDEEAIWNPSRIHAPTGRVKDKAFYESQMTAALREGRRVTAPDGIGVVVFAHKSTAGWEAILAALLKAGWVATASWPIDTEMGSRVNAMGTASLASSVHIVCRPRDNPDGSDRADDVGSWRGILAELPTRIHAWMPRLASEGVVGADAIFACIGPALEIYSRYSRVEKASGVAVLLGEYLEQVWAAVSKEALSMMFEGADASGLEEDARLTAMWLWTLGAGASATDETAGDATDDDGDGDGDGDEEDDRRATGKALAGFVLEFDTARKIAQGLGAHLEQLANVVELVGDKARLLAVAERAKYLFEKRWKDDQATGARDKAKKTQLGLFAEIEAAEKEGLLGEAGVPSMGETTLDRVHQAMILFGAGRSEALKRFVVEEGVGKDARFWKLAQSFSALYPAASDEKRWVDGLLARKKGLGF
ncbi:MAG: DUF1156 domain-containing protein [Polyangiaceae bacterium]